MPQLYERYLNGSYQKVYEELLQAHEQVFVEPLYEDALLVGKEMMRRVRQNVELVVARLQTIGYRFGEGFWEEDISSEAKALIEQDIPVFQAPPVETPERLVLLEQLAGPLPFALTCWYEQVGVVNLIGRFPSFDDRVLDDAYGAILDPLFIYSLEMLLKMGRGPGTGKAWNREQTISLSPDHYYKYHFSGSGAYSILLPAKVFDTSLLLERHQTTFVNYLRQCFRWGGFPGLEIENRLPENVVSFLTANLLDF